MQHQQSHQSLSEHASMIARFPGLSRQLEPHELKATIHSNGCTIKLTLLTFTDARMPNAPSRLLRAISLPFSLVWITPSLSMNGSACYHRPSSL
ncbi:hypothetical protein ACHAW6_001605 [Cyclotella cf. meneghiniana]